MPSNRKLAEGLSTLSRGFTQFGNAIEAKAKYEQAEREQVLKEQELKIQKFKLDAAEKEIATVKFGSLVGEYSRFMDQNPKSAELFKKMPETLATIQEVAPKMGLSIDRAMLTLQDKTEYFRLRRDNQANTIDAFGNLLANDAPPLAKALKDFAPRLKAAKDETERSELWKDGHDILTQAMSYSKAKEYNSGAITRPQLDAGYDVQTDGSGTPVRVKGMGVVNVTPKNKTSISTNESEDIRKGIAGALGVDAETLKDLTPQNRRQGYKLEDIDMLTEQASKQYLQGAGKITPQEAINQTKQAYVEEQKTVDGALKKLIEAKDPEINGAMKNAFDGVLDLNRVPLKKKKLFLADPNKFSKGE